MSHYDLIVIGGGPAGYHGAGLASKSGLKTLLFEKSTLGGICLNEGCVPTKALLYSAKLFDIARGSEKYGVIAQNVSYDHKTALDRKNKVVRTLVTGIAAKLKKHQTTVIQAEARLAGKNDQGFLVEAGGETYTARNILIASGSVPVLPKIAGLEASLQSGNLLTSREALALESIPTTLTVIGAGVIGLEMASYFNSAGSKVTVIELQDKIGGGLDTDIARILQKNLEKKGLEFRLGCSVQSIEGTKVFYNTPGSSDSELKSIESEKVLLAVGRKPNSEGLGLETLGITPQRGAVKTNERLETEVKGIYAAGDVNGLSMLAHTAYREAEVAVNTILGKTCSMDYLNSPSVIYTNPETASVGHTAESAALAGIATETVQASMRFSGRYVAENEGGDGICKVILEKTSRVLIGAHLIGNPASELIFGAVLMIGKKMRPEDLDEIIFPHPTVSEIFKEMLHE